MKSLTYLIAASALLVLPAIAQERSATGPMDTQMTWMALSGQISAVNTKVDAAYARMKQFETCGKKSMLYAPGQTGIDSDGCISAGGGIQAGMVGDGGTYRDRTMSVTFPKPFRAAPKVYVALQSYFYTGGCSSNFVDINLVPKNITATGFQIVFPADNGGCNTYQTKGVMWIAAESDPASSPASATPPVVTPPVVTPPVVTPRRSGWGKLPRLTSARRTG